MPDTVEAVFPDEDPHRAAAHKTKRQRRHRTKARLIATSVYLSQVQLDWLNEEADRRGVSLASLIRKGIDRLRKRGG